jgi:putative nucleotidyltransferase with HDIG domain
MSDYSTRELRGAPVKFVQILHFIVDKTYMNLRSPEPPMLRHGQGIEAHCQRVAAWAYELAAALGLPESRRKVVEQAALAHHYPEVLLDSEARHRLLADMNLEEAGDKSGITEEVRELLLVFQGKRPIPNAIVARLSAVLEISDDFDQYFESEPVSGADDADPCTDSSVETMMSYLQVTSRADVGRVIDRLPVFPRAAREVVRQATNPEVNAQALERVASQDPVLAGSLIQTANSAYYSPLKRVAGLQHAISYIGVDVARRVLLAACFRPSFASGRQYHLWNHSLDVAQVAEHLAHVSNAGFDPSEAFLAGLVHDVGRLAFSIMPPNFLERFYRLTLRGCPPVEVETCLSGLCHGEVGAQTLTQWKFPEELVEAVRWHHRPERNPQKLASLLHLAEFLTGAEEDIPSFARLTAACKQAGIDQSSFPEAGASGDGYLQTLRLVA